MIVTDCNRKPFFVYIDTMPPREKKRRASGAQLQADDAANHTQSASTPATSLSSDIDSSLLQQLQAKINTLEKESEKALGFTKAEQAWRTKCETQQKLIDALRADNARMSSLLSESASIPPLAVKSSPAYKLLEAELNAAKAQLATLDSKLTKAEARKPSSISTEVLEKKVAIYSAMTAVNVVPKPGSSVHSSLGPLGLFDITTTHPDSKTIIQFQLDFVRPEILADSETSTSSSTSIEYSPKDNCHLLPEFLQKVINFESEQCPMFLAKLTESLRNMDYRGSGDPLEEEEVVKEGQGRGVARSAVKISTMLPKTPAKTPESSSTAMLGRLGGASISLSGITPAATKRARELGVMSTPGAPLLSSLLSSSPFDAGLSRAPAPTPSGTAPRSARTSSKTPMSQTLIQHSQRKSLGGFQHNEGSVNKNNSPMN